LDEAALLSTVTVQAETKSAAAAAAEDDRLRMTGIAQIDDLI
jgi:hypothetical protein